MKIDIGYTDKDSNKDIYIGTLTLKDNKDINVPNNCNNSDIKEYLTLKGFLKIKSVCKWFDMKDPTQFIHISENVNKEQNNKNPNITKELFLNNSFKEYHNKGFGDFGDYYSYSKQFYSTIYKENVLVYFKTPINPQLQYWIMLIDNDLFEDIAKIRVNTVYDIHKIFDIVGIKERL